MRTSEIVPKSEFEAEANTYKEKILVFSEKGMQVFNPDNFQFEAYFDAGYGLGGFVSNATLLSNGNIIFASFYSTR